jgi:hypothetical protein
MAPTGKPKGFPALRQALVDKTNWSKQVLSLRVQAVKDRMPMKTKVAQAIVAHGKGLRLDRYLDGAALEEVQQVMARLGNGGAVPAASANGNGRRLARVSAPVARVLSFKAFGIKTTDPFLPREKQDQAHEMSKVYPILYLLENSIRTVIRGVMEASYGPSWWDTELTNAKAREMKNKVEQRLQREDEQSWHQQRGKHKIDYVDLSDLLVIAQSKRDVFFPRLLGKESWFQGLVEETAPSRNVLCHMNPLLENNVTALSVRLTHWHNHLKNREVQIRAAMTPAAAPST